MLTALQIHDAIYKRKVERATAQEMYYARVETSFVILEALSSKRCRELQIPSLVPEETSQRYNSYYLSQSVTL